LSKRHYDWDGLGRLYGSTDLSLAACYDYFDLKTNQLSRERGEAVNVPFCISVLNTDVLSFSVTAIAQSLPERLDEWYIRRDRKCREKTDPAQLLRLLPLGWTAKRKHESAQSGNELEALVLPDESRWLETPAVYLNDINPST
jgi:hypothetical protein